MTARSLALIALLCAPLSARADGPMNQVEYKTTYELRRGDPEDQEAIKRCLTAWDQHPFDPNGPWEPRWITTKVRVVGVGAEVTDDAATDYPQLIYVKPAVNVMTKTTLGLLNPNGWYCLEANVTVMGKLVLKAACDAHLADSRSGATVMGSNDAQGGVTVMGSTRVERVGDCAKSE